MIGKFRVLDLRPSGVMIEMTGRQGHVEIAGFADRLAVVDCLDHSNQTRMLHPVDDLAVELFLDGDMGHRRRRRCAVPMAFTRREPDDVAGADLLDGTAFALHATEARCDDQRLAERMGVPGGAGAGLEGDAGASRACGAGHGKQRVDTHAAGKPIGWSFGRRLRTASLDIHLYLLPFDAGVDVSTRVARYLGRAPGRD